MCVFWLDFFIEIDCFHAGGIASVEAKPLRDTRKKYGEVTNPIARKGQGRNSLAESRGREKVRGGGALAVPVVLFGSLGGTLGMFCFHHKTRHWYFRYGFPILLVVQLLLLGAGAYLLLR